MIDDDRYRTVDVPVRGGDSRLGIWDPVDVAAANGSGAATVVAVHGVTASHRCFSTLAQRLPEVRVIAPDLRGRGRSRDLPGPYGMAQHADDIAAAMKHLQVGAATLVGHSMGGFVALATFGAYPDLISSLVLVDGGLPLPEPQGLTPDELTTARLGLAKQRLSMTFPDRKSYQDFFRAHPAFVGDWNDAVADYVDYDLVGEPPHLRSATTFEAMAQDSDDLQRSGEWLLSALAAAPAGTEFLQAERGLAGEIPGLYADDWIRQWQTRFPQISVDRVGGVNHYTILFNDVGAAAVAAAVQSRVADAR